MDTIVYVVALLCSGVCCLVVAAGLAGLAWFLLRNSPSVAGQRAASVAPAPVRALSATPPMAAPDRPRQREPALATAILPTPPPPPPAGYVDDEGVDDDEQMATVVASPPVPGSKDSPPAALPPPPPRAPSEPSGPVLPATLEDPATGPGKKGGPPRSSGQTIIAFDDDDEDW